METSEIIKLTNSGNAPAKFSWEGDNKVFSVD